MALNNPAPPPERSARGRGRSLALRFAAALSLAVAVLLVLSVIRVPLPLGPFQSTLEARASDALGREVRARSLGLVLGIHPYIEIEGLRLAHLLADRPDLLRVERMELELSLLPLLNRHVDVRRASADGVVVRIDPEALLEAAPAEARSDELGQGGLGLEAWSLDVEELTLSDAEFERVRPGLEPDLGALDHLTGTLRWDESLELDFSGRYRDALLSARLEGASVAQLVKGAEAWPLRLVANLAGYAVELSARLSTTGEVYRIHDIEARAGQTDVTGWLALENLATRPRAAGHIEVGAVELALPDESLASPGEAEPLIGAGSLLTRPLAQRTEEDGSSPLELFMALLRDFETDLELEVERIAGLGPTVEDLVVALQVSGGVLRFPVTLTADEIPMSGTLQIDEVEGRPHLAFQLTANDFRVDELAATLFPLTPMVGSFEALRLELEGSGRSLLEFLETLRVDLQMSEASLTYGVERPVPLAIDSLALALAERGPLQLRVRGELLGEAIGLDLRGGTVEALLGERPWDLALEMRGAGATVTLSGKAIGYLHEMDLLGDLRIHGDHLARLEPWLGTLPVRDAPYSIRAHIDDTPERTRVDLEEVRLGQTKLEGALGQRRGGPPLVWANLRVEELDVSPYFVASSREPAHDPVQAESVDGIAFDAPILPGGWVIRDADIDLGVGTLVAGDLEVSDLRFRGAFRDGFLPESEFGLRIGAADFDGAITIDLREPPHTATFAFGAREVDAGLLLSHLRLAEEVDARAGGLRIEVSGEGSTLGDLLRKSDALVRLEDVHWTLRDPNSQVDIEVVLERGELTSTRGDEPIRLVAEGSLKGVPALFSMQTRQLSFFERPEDRVPIDLRLEMAGATLEISSGVLLPIARSELDLSLTLEGERFDRASPLFDYELPAIGPYRLAGRMLLTPLGYSLSELDLSVGESRLYGAGRLDLRGARPRIELELASDRVQLDDFAAAFGEATKAASEVGEGGPSWRDRSRYEQLGELREFWSPEGLLGFEGRVVASVAEVLSGEDELGRGDLVVTLEDGRLALDPLHLELEGGPFELRTEYAYVAQGDTNVIEARIRASTGRFDYGPLARRVDPESEMEGWIRLDLDIAGTAPEARTLLAHADGSIDFLAAPVNIDTDVFDLWAVSLLRFILPVIDPNPRSTLNCVVARFDLTDGIMTEKALLLDTTATVVRGTASIDFRKEQLRASLTPAPKNGELFSLQTRVGVRGSFEEFRVGVAPEDLAGTVLRFVTSIVVAPFERLFSDPLSADGEATCLAAWNSGND